MSQPLKEKRYIASELVAALALRHSKDVFIAECKDGPTQSVSRYLRMDAWAMNKSWAHPVAFGYEIKVSRSDFLQDNKWPAYLPLCNQFYFVAPAGLINPAELPAEAGLMTIAGKGHGARLLTKKKAPHRAITLPEDLYRYILMCRVVVGNPDGPIETNVQRWQQWLADKKENKRLGYEVSKAIREHANSLQTENESLKYQNERLADVKRMLDTMEISASHWNVEHEIKARLNGSHFYNPNLIRTLERARHELDTVLKITKNLEEKDQEPIAV